MFVIGDEAVTDVIGRLQLMPFMVLSARLCPPGIEGTVFAFLMSLSNFGATCASWAGALLLRYMHVTRLDYGRLWLAVLVRALLRLAPLLFLTMLLPEGTLDDVHAPQIGLGVGAGVGPSDRSSQQRGVEEEEEESGQFLLLPSPTSQEMAVLTRST